MNLKTRSNITFFNSIILFFIVIYLCYTYFTKVQQEEIVYIDNISLFNDFNMTKDLGKINTKKINQQKKKLDSLYSIYQIFKQNNQTKEIQKLESELRKEDQELKTMGDHFTNDVSQQVWNRLNEYIKEYGKTHKFKIIIGTQGNGNVMYADEAIDITKDLIEYANNKYEGN